MSRSRPGPSHVPPRLLWLALAVLLAACDGSGDLVTESGSGDDDAPPVLHNLLVAFAPYDAGTGRAGAFDFDAGALDDKVFLEFGAVVGGGKVLPTFEYRVAPDADVVSPIDGVVDRLIYQDDTSDYEVWLRTGSGAEWLVSADHVTGPLVAEGDAVGAGDVLGGAGSWSPDLRRTELMVTDGDNEAHCPFSLFDEATIDTYRAQVEALMADWEAYKSDTAIYDEPAMVDSGCNDWTYPA